MSCCLVLSGLVTLDKVLTEPQLDNRGSYLIPFPSSQGLRGSLFFPCGPSLLLLPSPSSFFFF